MNKFRLGTATLFVAITFILLVAIVTGLFVRLVIWAAVG